MQKHEFEGLLFSNVEAFELSFDLPEESIRHCGEFVKRFPRPKTSMTTSQQCPSKRISGIVPRYDKVVSGSVLAMDIGLDVIRDACPRFGNWLDRLESLGNDD